jgi:hypothetical protein
MDSHVLLRNNVYQGFVLMGFVAILPAPGCVKPVLQENVQQ